MQQHVGYLLNASPGVEEDRRHIDDGSTIVYWLMHTRWP